MKKFLVLIISILILSLSIFIIFITLNSKPNDEILTIEEDERLTSKGYKTFDSQYYTFKYEKNWIIVENRDNFVSIAPGKSSENCLVINKIEFKDINIFKNIKVAKNDFKKGSFSKLYETQNITAKRVTINGNEAMQIEAYLQER